MKTLLSGQDMECAVGDGAEGFVSLEMSGGGEDYGIIGEEGVRIGRHARWSRHETLILIAGKELEDRNWSKDRNGNTDSKWLPISHFCEANGVIRSAVQCRKRWFNLSADYKRIRDWQSLRGKQSFWLMNNNLRKENKLPGCFDRELFDALDKCLGKNLFTAAEIIFESGGADADEALFSDFEHSLGDEIPVTPEKDVVKSHTLMESPPMESLAPTPGTYETKLRDGHFTASAPFEEKPIIHPSARKKRKRPCNSPSAEESDEFKSKLFSMLESNSRILSAHLEAQNFNSQMDRNQRKEHAESLVGVLGKLVDAVGRIAGRL